MSSKIVDYIHYHMEFKEQFVEHKITGYVYNRRHNHGTLDLDLEGGVVIGNVHVETFPTLSLYLLQQKGEIAQFNAKRLAAIGESQECIIRKMCGDDTVHVSYK